MEKLIAGSTIRFRTFKDCAKDRIMAVPVKISREVWDRGVKVSVYPAKKILEEPEIPLWVRTVYESITGLYIEVTNPYDLDWDMQLRYGFIKPWEAKPQPIPQQTTAPYPASRSRYDYPSRKCPLPDEAFYKGYCPSPCNLTPCPRRLGPFDPGPHNPSAINDPRGPDPRGLIDPRGPR